jgi:hypothetical protein
MAWCGQSVSQPLPTAWLGCPVLLPGRPRHSCPLWFGFKQCCLCHPSDAVPHLGHIPRLCGQHWPVHTFQHLTWRVVLGICLDIGPAISFCLDYKMVLESINTRICSYCQYLFHFICLFFPIILFPFVLLKSMRETDSVPEHMLFMCKALCSVASYSKN